MELFEHRCTRCGGELTPTTNGHWVCRYCACKFDDDTAKKDLEMMKQLLDESKREIVSNLRRNLYDAVNAEYISSVEIQNICTQLKKYLPDDFRADFYLVASGSNIHRIAKYIRNINVDENYEHIGDAVTFLIRSLQPEYLLELNDLVERAYKYKDLTLYEKYATAISVEAERVLSGVYETKLPREIFVAYSSKDMSKVMDLVENLESQGFKCFVAARNLRHGRGAVENYDRAIKEAIDHCRTFVYVSSTKSRSLSCDALEIELSYVRQADIDGAPSEFRNNYASIPHKYKKPRVEYRIEESRRYNAADEIVNEFFDGYERVYSPDEVASRVVKQLFNREEGTHTEKKSSSQVAAKKYCVACGHENVASTNYCAQCGKNEFASSVTELLKKRESRQKTASSNTTNQADAHVSGAIDELIKNAEKKINEAREKIKTDGCSSSSIDAILRNAEQRMSNAKGAAKGEEPPKPLPKKFCSACGYQCDAKSKFCAKCGTSSFVANASELQKEQESKKESISSNEDYKSPYSGHTYSKPAQETVKATVAENTEPKVVKEIHIKDIAKNFISYEKAFFSTDTTTSQKLVHFTVISMVLCLIVMFSLLGISEWDGAGVDVAGGVCAFWLVANTVVVIVASVMRIMERAMMKKKGMEEKDFFKPRIILAVLSRVLVVLCAVFSGTDNFTDALGFINLLWAAICMIYACFPKEYNKIKFVKFIPLAERSIFAIVGGIISLNVFVFGLLTLF